LIWFPAVLDGIKIVSFLDGLNGGSLNPKGIESFSPRLARLREGLPWALVAKCLNPEGVAFQWLGMADSTPSGLRIL